MHETTDTMILMFSYIIINLKNHTDVCVGIFSSNHYRSVVWSGQRFYTNKAKEAHG